MPYLIPRLYGHKRASLIYRKVARKHLTSPQLGTTFSGMPNSSFAMQGCAYLKGLKASSVVVYHVSSRQGTIVYDVARTVWLGRHLQVQVTDDHKQRSKHGSTTTRMTSMP